MRRKCSAIANRFCSGEQSAEDCDECLEFVNTCDRCYVAGSNLSDGWTEGPNGETLCLDCASRPENTASPPHSGPIQAVGKGKED